MVLIVLVILTIASLLLGYVSSSMTTLFLCYLNVSMVSFIQMLNLSIGEANGATEDTLIQNLLLYLSFLSHVLWLYFVPMLVLDVFPW